MIIEIDGPVKGKGRPRATGRGNFIRFYTPKATKDYEDLIKAHCMYVRKMTGPLSLYITIWHKGPKRLWGTFCEKKPDGDNVIKLVMDALTGITYDDDNSICKGSWEKIYQCKSRLRIELYPAKIS